MPSPLRLPVLSLALAATACAARPDAVPAPPAPPAGSTTVEGTVVSIDMEPWTYDGHAVIEVDVPGRGRVPVQLPARWNLCSAPPVELEALAPGMRVQVVGQPDGADGKALTVCLDPAHRLVPLGDGAGG